MSIGASPSKQRPIVAPLPDVIGLGGAIAGLGGGLAMAVVAALIAAFLGRDIWEESKQIAAVVYGSAALAEPGFVAAPVLIGTLIHFVVSAALGAVFGIIVRRILHITSDFGTTIWLGLIYSMVIWSVAYFIVLPTLNPILLNSYAPAFIIQHLVYGMATGLIYS